MDRTLRLLLVEDDEVDRLAIRRALRKTSLSVDIDEMADGQFVGASLASGDYDCILLDYLLPPTDGLAILRAARSAGHTVPIIILTGHGDEHLAVELLQAGAADYLPKARLSPEALSKSLRNAVQVHEAERRQQQAEEALRATHEKMVDILESIRDAFFAVDHQGIFTYVNHQAESLLGAARNGLIDRPVWDCLPDSADWLCASLRQAEEQNTALQREGLLQPGIWLETHVYPHPDGLTVYLHDITERKQAEENLAYLATHDPLTNLPNRRLLSDRLEQALARTPWQERLVAVLFIDIDRFKLFNDSLGHNAGDELLNAVARRLEGAVRAGDSVARPGGDEFAVLLTDVDNKDDIQAVASALLEAVRQPFELAEREVFVTASVGISVAPHDGTDVTTLLKNADTAMYRAKQLGRNRSVSYAPKMNAQAHTRLTLETELRRALQRNELRLHYQPLLDIGRGDIVAAEALLRWQHAELGLVAPVEFLPLAEEIGLMVPIGEWVLRTACKQAKTWQEQGFPTMAVAVNLSNRQFRQTDLIEVVQAALDDSELAPNYLEIELTEDIVMHNIDSAIDTVRALRELGVRLSIDDFGTGYSSLAHLKRFPIDSLKIDRSFVRDITTDPSDAAIVAAVVAMAHKMGLEVVAEGIETAAQMEFVRQQGCDRVQGFLLGKPVTATEFSERLTQFRDASLASALPPQAKVATADLALAHS